MGFLDFLSEPQIPLEESFRHSLHEYYLNDQKVIQKLAKAQKNISAELEDGEKILFITYGTFGSFNGFGIVTNKRTMRFNNKIDEQIYHVDVGNVESRVHPNGDFFINVIGKKALPYRNFSLSQMGQKVKDIWAKYNLYLSVPDSDVSNALESFINELSSEYRN
jgi:hypothetical protein